MQKQSITACIFLHNEGKLFVAKRAKTKSFLPNIFEIPGGHIEFGESLEEGLKREIREELNIEIILEEVFHAFTYISHDKTLHTIEVDYLARMQDCNQHITLNSKDHSEYAWITEIDLNQYFDKNDAVLELAKKGFRLLRDRKNYP